MDSIIYENIDSNHEDYSFGYAKYGSFKIIMMQSKNDNVVNGFINANHLCNEGNKRLCKWVENKDSKILIDYLKIRINHNVAIKITDVENHLKGTYVHHLLIPHIASWISCEFAFYVSVIVNDHIKQEHASMIEEKEKLLRKQNKVIKKKDDKIDQLMEKLKIMEEKENLVLSKLDDTNGKLVDMGDDLVLAHDKLDITNDNLYDVKAKLGIAVKERVVPPKDSSKSETLAIVKLNSPKVFSEVEYDYFIAKRQKGTIKDCLAKHPGKIIIKFDCQPNAQIFFIKIKEELNDYIHFKHGHFRITNPKLTEERMIKKIKSIDQEKEEVILADPYSNMNCNELRQLWRDKGLKGFSRLTKESLIKGLLDFDNTSN